MSTLRVSLIGAAVVFLTSSMALADDAPKFMKETYPKQALGAALQESGALEGKDAVLSAKERELIGLAVAATVPCHYCVYYHTKAAKKAGASDAELKETLAQAGQVRKWSTVLNGAMYDMGAFRREIDAMFSGQ